MRSVAPRADALVIRHVANGHQFASLAPSGLHSRPSSDGSSSRKAEQVRRADAAWPGDQRQHGLQRVSGRGLIVVNPTRRGGIRSAGSAPFIARSPGENQMSAHSARAEAEGSTVGARVKHSLPARIRGYRFPFELSTLPAPRRKSRSLTSFITLTICFLANANCLSDGCVALRRFVGQLPGYAGLNWKSRASDGPHA
jgi:hypothetical protein